MTSLWPLVLLVPLSLLLYRQIKKYEAEEEEESWEEIRNVIEQVEFIQKVREESRKSKELRIESK